MNKSNIKEIIASFDRGITEMKLELAKPHSESVKRLIQKEIGNLEDNCYRYKLQAKAWGIKV